MSMVEKIKNQKQLGRKACGMYSTKDQMEDDETELKEDKSLVLVSFNSNVRKIIPSHPMSSNSTEGTVMKQSIRDIASKRNTTNIRAKKQKLNAQNLLPPTSPLRSYEMMMNVLCQW